MIYSRGVNLNGKIKDYKSYPAPLYPAFSKIPMLEATFFIGTANAFQHKMSLI
jgi:hypothetical protein